MRMNRMMAAMMQRTDVTRLSGTDIPSPFRDVAGRGWTVGSEGAVLLTELAGGTVGSFFDVVQEETSVNGRGMTDHDLPDSGHDREEQLLRRCLAYSFGCLESAAGQFGERSVSAYVSLSAGGLDDDTLTANVTFSMRRPDIAPYVADIESHVDEALLEIQLGDYSASTGTSGPWPVEVRQH
ncbi:hypothetical protein [Streptomyces sp. NPDC088358]|uniref:hypothetical protein n=1 Tax=Streptomyces sp. NPDC088358 TaxID=3365857 RepID=UPI00381D044D